MTFAEILSLLEPKFGGKIKDKKPDAIDPFVVVEPANLVEVCRFLRDDPRLRFDILNCISGVDYLVRLLNPVGQTRFRPKPG